MRDESHVAAQERMALGAVVLAGCTALCVLGSLAVCGCEVNAFDPQKQPAKGHDTGIEEQDLGATGDPGTEDGGTEDGGTEDGAPGCTDPEALNYDPFATVDDGSCIFQTTVTFNLDMSCAKDAAAPQVAGGGTFGDPGDHPMSDPDKDGVWTLTYPVPAGLTTGYTFTSDACFDWSCKEDIAGQPCATEPWNDRALTMGSESITINACFWHCGAGLCAELEAEGYPWPECGGK